RRAPELAAFLLCQAKILHRARGIPAWRAPLIPWMIGASGLLEGWGAFAVASFLLQARASSALAAVGVALALASAILWRTYVATARAQAIPPLSRRKLEAVSPLLHIVGHALPAVLSIAAYFLESGASLLALAGLAAIAGGATWKFTVIVRASYLQGFQLPRVPRRGSGALAAPSRFEPDLATPGGA